MILHVNSHGKFFLNLTMYSPCHPGFKASQNRTRSRRSDFTDRRYGNGAAGNSLHTNPCWSIGSFTPLMQWWDSISFCEGGVWVVIRPLAHCIPGCSIRDCWRGIDEGCCYHTVTLRIIKIRGKTSGPHRWGAYDQVGL